MFRKRLITIIIGWIITVSAFGQAAISGFSAGMPNGTIKNGEMNEISGLVASHVLPGYFWVHNDSGDDARIFLIDSEAVHKATVYLEGIHARDWEDIAWMKRNGRSHLLIGDIGDNKGQHPYIRVHVVEELVNPAFRDTIPQARIRTFFLAYEDGPRDAETLFYDPLDDALYIISKRELAVGVYRAELPDMPTDTLILTKVCNLPHTFFTGADIRRDGSEFIAKNLLEVFYWRREPGESIGEMLSKPAVRLPYRPEPQGEAIAFDMDATGYFTLSEKVLGMTAVLYYYPRISK